MVDDLECAAGAEGRDGSPVDLEQGIGAEDVEVGPRDCELGQRLEALGQVGVVGVEDREEVAVRVPERCVSRRCRSSSRLPNADDAVEVRLEHGHGAVGRAVVADDHLEGRQRLVKRGLDRLDDGLGRVVRGDDNGEGRPRAGLELADLGRRPEDASPRPIHHVLIMHTSPTVCKGRGNVCFVSTRPTTGELGAAPDPLRWRRRLQRVRHPAWLGTIRRTTPVSDHYGRDRGTPIDRYYIEQFLAAEREAIRGRVLEVMNRDYTVRFGAGVGTSDVLDIDPGNPEATIVSDLAAADSVPTSSFDCFILTQTLQYIYDLKAAVEHAHRILAPGGTLLCTVPVVSRIDRLQLGSECWRLTTVACSRLFGDVFPADSVAVRARGNVLVGVAFLVGMAAEELSPRELDRDDPFFPVIVSVRATKAR